MTPAVAPEIPTQPPLSKRASNLLIRNAKIREAFRKRYTEQPKVNGAKIYTREGVIAEIALDFFLSMGTVENILYK